MFPDSDFFPLVFDASLGTMSKRFFFVSRTSGISSKFSLGNRASKFDFPLLTSWLCMQGRQEKSEVQRQKSQMRPLECEMNIIFSASTMDFGKLLLVYFMRAPKP